MMKTTITSKVSMKSTKRRLLRCPDLVVFGRSVLGMMHRGRRDSTSVRPSTQLPWCIACAYLAMLGLAMAAEPETQAGVAPAGTYDVCCFGAKGDGVTLCTEAIQRAIDTVSREGGGRLVVPSPGTFLTGTIVLKDNVILEISAGATLLGSQQYADYAEDVGSCAYPEGIDRCLIYAKNARNIELTGRGTINGNGKPHHLLPLADTIKQRPMLVRFEDCTGIRVNQLTMVEAFSWCCHFVRCQDIRIQDLSIFNRRQDGIDLESCEDVTISDCNIKAGDDAIVLLANNNIPTRNVTISNCILRSKWAGVRFGPLSFGDINNVVIGNCIIRDCNGGGIKIAMLGGGEIRDCMFSNITMETVVCPILIMLVDWPQIGGTSSKPLPVGKISHLSFSHIVGTANSSDPRFPDAASTLFLHGHPRQDIKDITLSDIDLTLVGGGTAEQTVRRDMMDADKINHNDAWPEHQDWGVPPAAALYARHVNGLILDNVRFTLVQPDFRSLIFLYQSSDINLSGLTDRTPANNAAAQVTLFDCQDALITGCLNHRGGACFLALEGAQTRGISLIGNSITGFVREIQRGPEIPEDAVHSPLPPDKTY
jgi:hypothetical protein